MNDVCLQKVNYVCLQKKSKNPLKKKRRKIQRGKKKLKLSLILIPKQRVRSKMSRKNILLTFLILKRVVDEFHDFFKIGTGTINARKSLFEIDFLIPW
jgi:hypothetical protein